MNLRDTSHARSIVRQSGFTLVELMISIVLVLLLVIGINAIFRTTADTVGGGQATMASNRALRNAYDILNADFHGFLDAKRQPFLLIYSQNLPGFRDKNDEKSDPDYNTSLTEAQANEQTLWVRDSNGNVVMPYRVNPTGGTGQNRPSVQIDNRSHRVDTLTFFAEGRFRRQTGMQQRTPNVPNPNEVVLQSDFTSDTAYIWYGHVKQPDNNQANWIPSLTNPSANNNPYRPPGLTAINNTPQNANSNPNNFYANQWILGRMAILLAKPDPANGAVQNSNASGTYNQAYLNPAPTTNPPPQWQLLRPFTYGSRVTFNGLVNQPSLYELQNSFCDVAGISASDYLDRVKLAAIDATNKRIAAWYYPLLVQVNSAGFPAGGTPEFLLRYACKPWATRTATTAIDRRNDAALNAPAFLPGCSQFIVEFAGDYVTQDVANPDLSKRDKITAQAADGVLDFDVYPDQVTGIGQKRVRWYGLERKYPENTITASPNTPKGLYYYDVRPVWAWVSKDLGVLRPLPFEKMTPADTFPRPAMTTRGINSYVCAWNALDLQFPLDGEDDPNFMSDVTASGQQLRNAYPNGFMPWMIRVTMRVDDPNGRLPDGQTLQYVFSVPHK